MSSNQTNLPVEHDKVRKDDLKVITGIGSGVEARLNASGIHTFAQLADRTPESLAEVLTGMVGVTPARIARQAWIEQASQLAQQAAAVGIELEAPEPALSSRQFYETFTVELLVAEEDHTIRRTRVTRVQDGAQDSWAGFKLEKLVGFVAQTAGLDLPQPSIELLNQSGLSDQPEVKAEVLPVSQARAELTAIDLLSSETHHSTHMLGKGQPFEVLLKIELSGLQSDQPAVVNLPYHVRVIARQLGSHSEHVVCAVEDSLRDENGGQLKLKAAGLPIGTYRIFADLNLSLPGREIEKISGAGSLLQVY